MSSLDDETRSQFAESLLREYLQRFSDCDLNLHFDVDPVGTVARIVTVGLEQLFPCEVLGHDYKHVDGTNMAQCEREDCGHRQTINLPWRKGMEQLKIGGQK